MNVRRQAQYADKIRYASEQIRKQVDAIDKAVETGTRNLGRLVQDAKKTLRALNIELNDDAEERESPIEVPQLADRESGIELATGSEG